VKYLQKRAGQNFCFSRIPLPLPSPKKRGIALYLFKDTGKEVQIILSHSYKPE